MTFREFQRVNALRCREAFPQPSPWPIEMWCLAIAGEAGELCNLVKKVKRGDFSLAERRQEILKEIADVMTYCDLAMTVLEADTEEELMAKFDEVSKRVGWVEQNVFMLNEITAACPHCPNPQDETTGF